MAIWDNNSTAKLSADSHKCLSCGSNLFFELKEGTLNCQSCGNKYFPEIFDVSELLSSIKEGDAGDEEAGKHEIVCNSCGSVMVTDEKTMSTVCAFCGSPALVTRRLQKEFRPDYIIPFKNTAKEITEMVKTWAKERTYLPKDFWRKCSFTNPTGIYVPFWLVDANCYFDIVGGGSYIKRGEALDRVNFFEVERKGTFRMEKVPFDGSIRINDRMMEAIEPFDYSELVPFSSAYLQGFYSERYELTVNDMANRITNRFRDYMYSAAVDHMEIKKYEQFNLEQDKSTTDGFVIKYALLPVWFMKLKYRRTIYNIVVNGQTGEVAGTTPTREREINHARNVYKFKKYAAAYGTSFLVAIPPAIIIAGFIKLVILYFMPMGPEYYGYQYITFIGYLFRAYWVVLLIFLIRTTLNIFGIGFFGFGKNIDSLIQDDVFSARRVASDYGNDINKLDEMPSVENYLKNGQSFKLEEEDRQIF